MLIYAIYAIYADTDLTVGINKFHDFWLMTAMMNLVVLKRMKQFGNNVFVDNLHDGDIDG